MGDLTHRLTADDSDWSIIIIAGADPGDTDPMFKPEKYKKNL